MILVTVHWGAFLSQLDLDLFIPTPADSEDLSLFYKKNKKKKPPHLCKAWLKHIGWIIFLSFLVINVSTGSFSGFLLNTFAPPIFCVPYLKSCYTEINPFFSLT